MFSKNPNRGNGVAMKPGAPLAAVQQPTTQQLHDMLRRANERIADLESKMQQLLGAIYVDASGDVEIAAVTRVRIVAGTKIELIADQSVDIAGNQEVKVRDQNGNSIRLATNGLVNNAAASFQINSGTVQTSAGMMQVNAGMAKFSGVVQCDTMIANSVVGSSYTPGAGNIW